MGTAGLILLVSLLLNLDPIVSTQWSGWRLEED